MAEITKLRFLKREGFSVSGGQNGQIRNPPYLPIPSVFSLPVRAETKTIIKEYTYPVSERTAKTQGTPHCTQGSEETSLGGIEAGLGSQTFYGHFEWDKDQ